MPEQPQSQPQSNPKKSLPFPLMILLICVAIVMVAYAYRKYFVAQEPTAPIAIPSEEFTPEDQDTGTCKNLCGNGVCEEIVCMAIGCPCAETPTTCPQDCK